MSSYISTQKTEPGKLWVVATPLGNPADLSPRAQEILSVADCILAEDTRRSGILFANCGIPGGKFISLHEHNEESKLNSLLAEMAQGKNMALISDAGTPLLSDPGYRLVRACRAQGYQVIPLPGPSAPLTALCASGLPPQPFIFLGFPPRKKGEQQNFFSPYRDLNLTIIFFERKDRVQSTLKLLYQLYGKRETCIARELTKTHEEFIIFYLGEWHKLPSELLGEITIIIGPPEAGSKSSIAEVQTALSESIALAEAAGERLKLRELARQAKEKVQGWSVDEIYRLAGEHKTELK